MNENEITAKTVAVAYRPMPMREAIRKVQQLRQEMGESAKGLHGFEAEGVRA